MVMRVDESTPASHANIGLIRRLQAEHIADSLTDASLAACSPEDIRHLISDLRRHQDELELQNEELRRAQNELERVRTRYVDLYNLAPVGYFTLNARGIIQEANRTAATLLQVSLSDVIGHPFTQFIVPDDQDRYYLYRLHLTVTDEPQVCELRMRCPGEAQFWARLETTVVQEEDHGAMVYRMVMSDIRREKQLLVDVQTAHQEATVALAQLDAIVTSTPIGIAYLDRELRYRMVNPALAALNGRSPADHFGRTLAELIPPMALLLEPFMRHVLTTGVAVCDLELNDLYDPLNRIVRDILICLFPVPAGPTGEITGVGVAVTDITAQKQAALALERQRQQLDAIVRTMHEGVIAFEPNGTIVIINNASLRLAGLDCTTPDGSLTAMGQVVTQIPYDAHGRAIPPDDWPMNRVVRGEQFVGVEICMRSAGQPDEWRAFSGTPVYDEHGTLVLGVITAHDITQRKRDEAALQAQANALSCTNTQLTRALGLKNEFLAMMSHELRTPLTVILGVCGALEAEIYGSLNDQQHHALTTITTSGKHLTSILSNIFDLARLEAGQETLNHQPIEVDALCRTAMCFVENAAQQKHIQLRCSVNPGAEGVIADERRMIQILVNLLDNAIKFTPEGGAVGLDVFTNAGQKHIRFVVWDTGIGIAKADYTRLFQSFTQVDGQLSRQYGGIGLGLSLVRRLVDLHGGNIGIESTIGQGSRFTVSLSWSEDDNMALRSAQTAVLRQ
jgi:PAS domain S-box-containing protein